MAAPPLGRGTAGDTASHDVATDGRRVLYASLVVTALLFVVPGGDIVGYPLLLLSTLVHELGHGLAAILVGGDFDTLRVFADGSGVALTAAQPGAFREAVIAAGGLVGPGIAAGIGLALAARPRAARFTVALLGAFLVLALLLWVRGLAGFLLTAVFAVISLAIAVYRPGPEAPRSPRGGARSGWAPQLWLVFLAVQLGLSVYSRRDYLFTREARTGRGALPSDAAALADALIGPFWLWGAICGLVALAALGAGALAFLRATRPPSV